MKVCLSAMSAQTFLNCLVRRARVRRWGSRSELVVLRGRPIRFSVIDGDSGDQLRAGYESEVLDFIDSLSSRSILYDLGASIGHFALYAASRGVTTIAFEPDPANFGALEANIRANHFKNMTIAAIAISDRNDDAMVLRSDSSKPRVGDHHKVLEGDTFSGYDDIGLQLDRAVNVRAMSLDSAIEILKLPAPTALKVDIDGSELAFVRGAERTLRDDRLKSVLIELWKPSKHYSVIVAALEAAGLEATSEHQVYSGCGIEKGLYNIRFDRIISYAT